MILEVLTSIVSTATGFSFQRSLGGLPTAVTTSSNVQCVYFAACPTPLGIITWATIRIMLEAGLPVDSHSQHGATPLHWAAWRGNPEMIRSRFCYHPTLEQTDADFNGTPLGWTIYASENGWNPGAGDYAGTVTALLERGAKLPDKLAGTAGLEAVRLCHEENGLHGRTPSNHSPDAVRLSAEMAAELYWSRLRRQPLALGL